MQEPRLGRPQVRTLVIAAELAAKGCECTRVLPGHATSPGWKQPVQKDIRPDAEAFVDRCMDTRGSTPRGRPTSPRDHPGVSSCLRSEALCASQSHVGKVGSVPGTLGVTAGALRETGAQAQLADQSNALSSWRCGSRSEKQFFAGQARQQPTVVDGVIY